MDNDTRKESTSMNFINIIIKKLNLEDPLESSDYKVKSIKLFCIFLLFMVVVAIIQNDIHPILLITLIIISVVLFYIANIVIYIRYLNGRGYSKKEILSALFITHYIYDFIRKK